MSAVQLNPLLWSAYDELCAMGELAGAAAAAAAAAAVTPAAAVLAVTISAPPATAAGDELLLLLHRLAARSCAAFALEEDGVPCHIIRQHVAWH
jgi:hypothetical protein